MSNCFRCSPAAFLGSCGDAGPQLWALWTWVSARSSSSLPACSLQSSVLFSSTSSRPAAVSSPSESVSHTDSYRYNRLVPFEPSTAVSVPVTSCPVLLWSVVQESPVSSAHVPESPAPMYVTPESPLKPGTNSLLCLHLGSLCYGKA